MHDLTETAAARRAPLPNQETDAFRLLDGDGDGLPGIEIDELAGHWLVSTRDASIPAPLYRVLKASGRSIYHKRLDQNQKDSPTHLCGPEIRHPFTIRENGVLFELSFHSGYSQGIFLDQRDNRKALHELLKPGQTLLNTFAYTGAFSVFGGLAGATTTTLDLSQPYLDWAKRNFALNGADPTTQYFCKGDTFHWLRRFAKQGRSFDAIVLDPPTFSRDHDGKVFRVEKDYGQLVELAAACLAPNGTLLACTNCRQISDRDFAQQIRGAFRGEIELTRRPMPTDFTAPSYLKSIWVRRSD